MMAKAASSSADLVFLDLEDSVAPDQKTAARENVVAGLTELNWEGKVRAYRINGVDTRWCHGDLVEVLSRAGEHVDVIIVPKVKSARHVCFIDDLLTQLEREYNLESGRIGLEVLIEETEALACVEEIAASSARLEALILGVGDLSASQGMRAAHVGLRADGTALYPGDIWHYARCRMIVAARANGLDAIDGPFGMFRDPDGYREEALRATALGAVGKWCIHPDQIPLANEVFSPTKAEIEEARRVVEAVRAAEVAGVGAAEVDGAMVDAATARIFESLLERGRLCEK
jgi:citrate lyase subunit beta/citryl-CoA lyase